MLTNQDYKNRALTSLDGNWGSMVLTTLVYFIISGFLSSLFSAPFGSETVAGYSVQGGWSLLCLPLSWGFSIIFLNLIRKGDFRLERLFDGYKDFIRIFLAGFLVTLAVVIGCLFLIVPGIILALMFAQTEYILKDDQEISAVDAMAKSIRMMNGHKVELFVLWLSFIGWFLLSLLTLGLGFLLLAPYFNTTMAHYYEDLKAECSE